MWFFVSIARQMYHVCGKLWKPKHARLQDITNGKRMGDQIWESEPTNDQRFVSRGDLSFTESNPSSFSDAPHISCDWQHLWGKKSVLQVMYWHISYKHRGTFWRVCFPACLCPERFLLYLPRWFFLVSSVGDFRLVGFLFNGCKVGPL